VEKSEMEYNVDLVSAWLKYHGRAEPDFHGLPALQIPPEWKAPVQSPDMCFVVLNKGSAQNLAPESYEDLAARELEHDKSVSFLVSGQGETELVARFESGPLSKFPKFKVQKSFGKISELIVYVSRLKQLVSSSTGPLHIAHAAGVPVVGYYPSLKVQSFSRWRPHGYWHAAPVEFRSLPESRP
jgi:ADP-heptose:LPS heptosyltransferase